MKCRSRLPRATGRYVNDVLADFSAPERRGRAIGQSENEGET
jgi:hypothetical protein